MGSRSSRCRYRAVLGVMAANVHMRLNQTQQAREMATWALSVLSDD